MSRSGTFTESNGTASTARFTTTATIRCEAYPADDGSPPPSPTPSSDVAVGKKWQNNMNNISNDKISNGKSLSNGHGPRAGLTSLNGASFGAAVKKTGSVEDRWKPNSTSTSRDYTSPAKQGALNGLQEPVRPSRISLAAMGSKNDNSHDFKSGAIGLGGPAPPPPPAPPMPSFGATNGSSAGFSGRSVSRSDMTNKVSLPTAAHSFGANTNSLPRGFNSKTFNHNSVPRGYTPSSVNGAAPCKVSTSSTPTLPAGSSSTLPRGFNLSVAANGGTKMSGGSTIPSAGLANALRRADSADPNPTSAKPKADPNDPQVRKLVYNMYRGLLDKKHDHSNTIISNLPQLQVDRDEGVKNRVLSMMKQQEELKSGKISTMNGPAGPPPPPPPPPFIVEGATPPVRPEPIQVARPAPRSAPVMPLIAPPAALAGAMMKDKKPFTYTPGGLDLSEISPGPGVAIAPDMNSAPMQSRSFRILQNVVDSEASEPQGPVHIGKVKTQQQQPKLQHGGSNGGAIPSRAFRALQQHAYGGQQEDAEVPPRSSASPPHPMSTSPTPSFPSSSSSQSHASSSERFGDRYSQPLSGTTFRSVAPQIVVNEGPAKHRNVVNSALTKQREASPSRHWHVNTTSSSRSASPGNQNNLSDDQSRLLKFISQEAADSANRGETGVAVPKKLYDGAKIPSRVFKQLQTEFSDSSDVPDSKSPTSYDPSSSTDGGDKPQLSAGLLRLLQSDFDKLQNDRSPSNIENCVLSSSYGNENNPIYKNGIVNTAATKEHVLKELTTQFDPVTQRRKPRAAPGRVFRYLQQQYDEPEDMDERPVYSNNNNIANKKSSGRSNSLVTSTIGQKSAYLNGSGYSSPRHNSIPNEMTSHELTGRPRFHSPSFAHLQSQYHQEEEGKDTVNGNEETNGASRTSSRNGSSADDVDNHDLSSLSITEEGDPVLSKPYVGNRIPGRTFRMLQENYTSHPSVLQARK